MRALRFSCCTTLITSIFLLLDGTMGSVRDSPEVLWVLMEQPGLHNGPVRTDKEMSCEYPVCNPVFLKSPDFPGLAEVGYS